MTTCEMPIQEKKKAIKAALKGCRKMSHSTEAQLEALGIHVENSKKHVKLYCNGKFYTMPSTASDWRAGANLASVICRELEKESLQGEREKKNL